MKRTWMVRLVVVIAALVLLPMPSPAAETANGCLACHENGKKMAELGFGHFTVTQKEVEAQSGMQADCHQCHLGNPEAADKQQAHKGLARLLVVGKKGLTADVDTPRSYPLQFGSNQMNKIYLATDKDGKKVRDPRVAAISWHDKRTDTLSQDFDTLEKTCGACHPQQFAEFGKSAMGSNSKQKQYQSWTDQSRGPHDCGVWFDGNYDRIQANTGVTMPKQGHMVSQKACNTCHVGCLDCHYDPQPKNPGKPSMGSHRFVKTPPSLSCYGNGRTSICHAGPEDRRRGAGYYGGSFSFPEGNEPDVHLKAKVGCLDCHESSKSDKSLGHGTVKRQAEGSCLRCHQKAVQSHAASLHKRLSCEACHIQRVAGYQGTYWGPGKMAGAETTFFKFKAYYGIMPEPILIRDQKGRWIPVKPFPMAAMNQIASPFTAGLHWRFPADLPDSQRTDDAWGYTGLHGGMPDNNQALTWLQIDKMSHKLGKARSCDSCHGDLDGRQLQEVTWEYEDPGAAPFKGSQRVIADRTGLYVRDIKALDKIELEQGYKLSAFAPWIYLKDVWQIPGDFSLPKLKDRGYYRKVQGDLLGARQSGLLHR